MWLDAVQLWGHSEYRSEELHTAASTMGKSIESGSLGVLTASYECLLVWAVAPWFFSS